MPPQADPIFIEPKVAAQDPANGAAFIFMHGFGDDAMGVENIPRQFQAADKLSYMKWVLPNAPHNMDALDTAWYAPSGLSPTPSARPELDDPEDEDGMIRSRKYIEGLIDDLVGQGYPLNRIVIGGFSQGCAMTLLLGLTGKYAGKLAGMCCLMGYLPLKDDIERLRKENDLPEKVEAQTPILLMRGTRDMLVPRRYFTMCTEKLKELGVKDEYLATIEAEGVAHQIVPTVMAYMCGWLEKIVPAA